MAELVDGQFRMAHFKPSSDVWPNVYPPIPAPLEHHRVTRCDRGRRHEGLVDSRVFRGGVRRLASQIPYAGAVDTDGSWRIVRYREGAAAFDVRSGRDPAAISGPGPHRIVLECTGDGGRISITLWVNGVELAKADGGRGTAFGPGPGLLVDPRSGRSTSGSTTSLSRTAL